MARQMGHSRSVNWGIVMRTTMIDRMIQDLIPTGVDLVLNLGAGLDTRPFRMELPRDLRWVEVDSAPLLKYKSEKLKGASPRCRLETIALDLSRAESRRQALGDLTKSSAKALVLTEGLITYLRNEQAAELADDLHANEKITHWIQNYVSPLTLIYLRTFRRHKLRNAPVQFSPRNWLEFFSERNWQLLEARSYADQGRKLGRYPDERFYVKPLFHLIPGLYGNGGCAVFRRM